MLHHLLASNLLVALQAVHALLGVDTHFVLVDDRIMLPGMALGALAGRLNEALAGLVRLESRPLPVEQVSCQDQAEADDQRDEHRTKGHRHLIRWIGLALGSSDG